MKSLSLLEDNGIVRNYDNILENLSQRLGNRYISLYDLEEMLNKGVDLLYFDETAKNSEDTTTVEPSSGVKILRTQIRDAKTGFLLCISYRKKAGEKLWNGCMVGTQYFLYNKHFSNAAPTVTTTPTLRPSVPDKNLQEIYNNLFYKENWKINENLNFLRDYFRSLRRKIEKDVKDGKTSCYVLNKEENSILFNARLLDLFGNHIHVISSYRNNVVGDVKMVSSTRDLSDHGFERRMLNIDPTEFFHSLNDIFFKAKIDDFDFTNPYALNHVINERRDRLPEDVRNKSPMEIANSLKTAVQHSITMSQTDCRFVVPMYSIEHGKTQFLMPIYFNFGEDMKPANALVVDNSNGYWSIKTILNLREAYLNARLMGVPTACWLEAIDTESA